MSSRSWVRPLSSDEQQYYLDRITHKYADEIAESDASAFEITIPELSVVSATDHADEISIDGFLPQFEESGANETGDKSAQSISLDDLINLADDNLGDAAETEVTDLVSDIAATSQAEADEHAPSEKTRELIELVSAELGEIVEFYHANAVSSEQDISTVVKEAAVLVGNIANAVKLIGLDALSDLCEGMSQVFDQARRP